MKNKLICAAAVFALFIMVITAFFLISDRMVNPQDVKSEQIVAANELERVHIKTASKIIASIITAIKITSSLS